MLEEQDFEPITESVTFEPGVSSRSVSVTIVNDDIREESEEFLVRGPTCHQIYLLFTNDNRFHSVEMTW